MAGAVAALMMVAGGAVAQSIGSVGGPAERPPASFTGQQYVDSRGCVFMRAGLAGQVNWVPRIDRNRQVICDRPPSLGPRPAAPAVAEAAPPDVGPPMETVASAMVPAAPRRAAARAAPAAQPVVPQVPPSPVVAAAPAVEVVIRPATVVSGAIACYRNAPRAVRVRTNAGAAITVCTTEIGARWLADNPVLPAGRAIGPARVAEAAAAPVPAPAPVAVGAPPPGFRAAWADGRLNPQRGPRTAAGQAQQDQVWTREVPARAVAAAVPQDGSARLSSRGADPQRALYVQVGSFGVAANAARARATLQALGLPTARAQAKGMTVVLAGPFGSENEARTARRAAQGAGFGDAFIR